jgi:steroid 5-alpha reductase family enzyme
LLEKGLKKTRPEYAEYIAKTSSFIPWPPKG